MSKQIINPDTFSLQIRETYRYNAGWEHLDRHKYLGECRAVAATKERGNNEYWKNTVAVAVFQECEATREEIETALMDTLSGSNCRHEHDCCGCVSRNTYKIRKMRDITVDGRGGELYAVRISCSRNV